MLALMASALTMLQIHLKYFVADEAQVAAIMKAKLKSLFDV
jgi:hypothetical protein